MNYIMKCKYLLLQIYIYIEREIIKVSKLEEIELKLYAFAEGQKKSLIYPIPRVRRQRPFVEVKMKEILTGRQT